MLAGHRHEHASHFGIFADVFGKRLANKVPQRDVVLGLAADFAGMASETPPRVDEPAQLLAVVWCLHAFRPVTFWLKQRVVRRLCWDCFCIKSCGRGSRRNGSRQQISSRCLI